jgi:hypothetical protein
MIMGAVSNDWRIGWPQWRRPKLRHSASTQDKDDERSYSGAVLRRGAYLLDHPTLPNIQNLAAAEGFPSCFAPATLGPLVTTTTPFIPAS